MADQKNNQRNDKKPPRALSPTPLRDWVARQSTARKAGLVGLFALVIACGGKAGAILSFSPVPATHQLLFVLLAGAMLGSRLGAVSSLLYLVLAAVTGRLWPVGAGPDALTGPLAGYLWSLPLAAYFCGFFVERAQSEKPVHFAIGVCAAIGTFDAFGSVRLLGALEVNAAESFARGAGLFMGQHIAHGAITVFIASSASAELQAREKK
jgi:biotin transport system substrate-specific component